MVEQLQRVALLLGSTWVMYLLFILSIWSIGIMIERVIFFNTHKDDIDKLGLAMLERLRENDLRGAQQVLSKGKSIEAKVMLAVVPWVEGGPEAVEEALDAELRRKKGELEKGMTVMGTLGNNAPFVGLLGTVLGVIVAFNQLGQGQNKAAMGNVMTGIAEALIATAVGLVVALPAVVAYNVMAKKVADVESNVAILGKQLLAHLKSQSKLATEFSMRGEHDSAPKRQGSPAAEPRAKAASPEFD